MNPPTLFCTTFTLYLYAHFFCLTSNARKVYQMNEYLKNLTSLDSSHLEVFLEIFIFLNSNLNFEFGPIFGQTGAVYWNRSPPV